MRATVSGASLSTKLGWNCRTSWAFWCTEAALSQKNAGFFSEFRAQDTRRNGNTGWTELNCKESCGESRSKFVNVCLLTIGLPQRQIMLFAKRSQPLRKTSGPLHSVCLACLTVSIDSWVPSPGACAPVGCEVVRSSRKRGTQLCDHWKSLLSAHAMVAATRAHFAWLCAGQARCNGILALWFGNACDVWSHFVRMLMRFCRWMVAMVKFPMNWQQKILIRSYKGRKHAAIIAHVVWVFSLVWLGIACLARQLNQRTTIHTRRDSWDLRFPQPPPLWPQPPQICPK